MRRIGLRPLLAVLAAMFSIFLSTPAWADSIIFINPGNVNYTAAEFADPNDLFKDCDANQGGGPYAGYDVWVFNLPSQGGDAGVFVSLAVTFEKPGGQQLVVNIPADAGTIFFNGTSKAWLKVEAGWELKGASAVITGAAEQFVLTHVCPANGASPSPSASASPSASTSPSPSTSVSPSPSGPNVTPSPDPGSSVTPSVSQPPLPRTGTAIAAIFYVGLVAVAGGALILLLLHRKRAGLASGSED